MLSADAGQRGWHDSSPEGRGIVSELLSLPRAARRLGVKSQWLRLEAENRRVPCVEAGKTFLFDEQALTEAIRDRAAKAPFENARNEESEKST